MDLKNYLVLISAVINLFLGGFVFLKGKDKAINRTFALIAFGVFYWSVGMVLYRASTTIDNSVVWCRMLYTAPIIIVGSFLYFSYIFPYEKSYVKSKIIYFVLFLCFLFFYISLFTNGIIENIVFHPGQEKEIIFGNLYLPYSLFISAFFIWAYVELLISRKKSKGIERVQINYVFWGTFSASVLGMTTNLLLPTFGIFIFNWLGQILSLFMVVFIAYAVVKHHLLDIKSIATELFSIGILIVSFAQIVTADDFSDLLVSIGIFLILFIFAVLLVRSVYKEVERKEELQIMADKLASANDRLRELDNAKTEFISIASHQLRTPLTAIKGFISLMLEGTYGKIGRKQKDVLEKIYSANEHLVKLVEDLLNVSRIEAGRLKYEFEPYQVEDIVDELVANFLVTSKVKKLYLHKKLPKRKLPKTEIDESKIRECISNLIDNALKYTRRGGVTVKVEGVKNKASRKIEKIRVIVSDTGIGVTKEEFPNLFSKFARGKTSSKMEVGGTGLGLFVVKSMIEAHGGTITAESDGLNKGSRFIIDIPVKHPETSYSSCSATNYRLGSEK